MYRIDSEGLEEKIREAKFSTDEEGNKNIRESLLSLVKELCKYTTQVNQTLVEGILERDDNSSIEDIVVALLSDADVEEKNFEAVGLYKMVDANEKRIFINDEYENIRIINGDISGKKKYKGKYLKSGKVVEFEYELKFDNSFLKLQELLYKYAELYNICNPVILSPFSHKSFFVVYSNEIEKENVELDFCFEENGIKAIENKNLFWNIKKDSSLNKTYDAKVPYGTDTRYRYTFGKTKKGKYVLPYPVNNQTTIYDVIIGVNGVELVTNRDMDDFILLEYFDVDNDSSNVKAMISAGVLTSNKREYKGVITGRILSEGDVEHAIAPFREWKNLSCSIAQGNSNKIIRYSSRYRVDRKDKVMFSPISRKYICFSKTDGVFLTDYANYVIEYLEYYYPEIEWVGER